MIVATRCRVGWCWRQFWTSELASDYVKVDFCTLRPVQVGAGVLWLTPKRILNAFLASAQICAAEFSSKPAM
jgi:hypothetical protein